MTRDGGRDALQFQAGTESLPPLGLRETPETRLVLSTWLLRGASSRSKKSGLATTAIARGLGSTELESNMTNGTGSAGMIAGGTTQGAMLDLIQQGESFIYAAVTREGAIKIGVSRNLRDRKKHLDFGGFDHFIALVPGDMAAEQAIHRALAQHRIYGWREYYYPVPDLLPMLNAMRARMKLCPLRQKDLPRIAQCTFHRRVMEHQEADSRLVRAVMGGM